MIFALAPLLSGVIPAQVAPVPLVISGGSLMGQPWPRRTRHCAPEIKLAE
jgi:hypothetical protein